MKQKLSIEPGSKTISSLIDSIRQGNIQVPPFQRDFVWERKNIIRLFDSIRKGYPIGTLFLWRPAVQSNWDGISKLGSYTIPKTSPQDFYVLDGFQRLSTLFGCLVNHEQTELECDESMWEHLFNLYYDSKEDTFTFLSSKSKPKYWHFPMTVFLVASDFRKYSREHLEKECQNDLEIIELLNKADKVSSILLDYRIGTIEINNADINQAAEIFSRINTEGTKVSIDWMVHALSYDKKSNFNLAKVTDDLLGSLQDYHFETLSRNTVFRCFQSSFGKIYFDQDKIENLAVGEDFRDVIEKESVPAIQKAVKFLYEDLHVLDRTLLPYNIQIVFIMEFFRQLDNPTEKQIKWLKLWFWRTTYSNFFTNSSLSDQRQEYNLFRTYLKTGKYEPSDILKQNLSLEYSFPEKINLRSVRSSALALFVINNLFSRCPEQMRDAVYRQTVVDVPDSNLCSKHTLFTDVEAKAYKHLTQESSDLIYSHKDSKNDWDVLRASFFTNLNQVKSRQERMINAEKEFLTQQIGFKIKQD